MLGKREQDPDASVRYRCDRVSRVNGMYFFSTRENTLEGPFQTKEDAARETEVYIRRMIEGKAPDSQPYTSSLNG